MTTATREVEVRAAPVRGQTQWALVWARLRRKRIAMISLGVILFVYTLGLLAPILAPYSYTATNLTEALQGPSAAHWLGTDTIGRDMLSRVMYSARTTLIVTTAVVLSGSLVIGPALGLLSGYRGGWVDMFIMRLGEIFSGLPGLIMLILINVTLGQRVTDAVRAFERLSGIPGIVASGAPSYLLVFSALSLFGWVGSARFIRAQVLQLRERDFIIAAEATGATPRRVITHHLLPNIAFLIILGVSGALGGVAGSEIVLTWLGVGVQPPAASFGAMIFEGSGVRNFQAHPHLLLVPGIVVSSLLFAFNLFGDALNDAFRGA